MAPILFTIGPFNVYAFGFFLAVAFLFSTFLVWRYAREELMEGELLDAYLYTSLISLISARTIYIIFNFEQFGTNFLKYIVVRETPGLSLLGGMLGGFIFLFFYSKAKKLNFPHTLDIFSMAVSLSLFFAKIGVELGGAGFGQETQLPWGVKIIGFSGRRHPVELYEAFLYFVLTIFLIKVSKKIYRMKYLEGLNFVIFTFSFAFINFLIEFFKAETLYLYGVNFKQFLSVMIMITMLIPFFVIFKRIRIKK